MKIRLPIKCSTAKKCDGAIETMLNGFFDGINNFFTFCAETKVIRWTIIGFIALLMFVSTSLVLYMLGGIVFGSAIAISTGHGGEIMSVDSWYFIWGGYIGIPIGWLIFAISTGHLRFECIDAKEGNDIDENADLIKRVLGNDP